MVFPRNAPDFNITQAGSTCQEGGHCSLLRLGLSFRIDDTPSYLVIKIYRAFCCRFVCLRVKYVEYFWECKRFHKNIDLSQSVQKNDPLLLMTYQEVDI